jgi:hypothetical protein
VLGGQRVALFGDGVGVAGARADLAA